VPRIGLEMRVGESCGQPDHYQHDQNFRQREPGRAADAESRRGYRSHEPMSASNPVPPGAPSAPKLNTSYSPRSPGLMYW